VRQAAAAAAAAVAAEQDVKRVTYRFPEQSFSGWGEEQSNDNN